MSEEKKEETKVVMPKEEPKASPPPKEAPKKIVDKTPYNWKFFSEDGKFKAENTESGETYEGTKKDFFDQMRG